MAPVDYLFVIPAIAVLGYEIYGLIAVAPKIRVRGRVPGTAGSRALLIFLIVMAFLRPEDIMKLPVVYACAVSVLAIHSFVTAGPGDDAFYNSATKVEYRDIDYYQDIRDFKDGFSMRFHCLSGKEYVVLYKEGQREALEKIMNDHRVRDYDKIVFFDDKDDKEEKK